MICYDESALNSKAGLLEVVNQKIGDTAPIHTHTFYEIFLVASGSALHLINDTVQTIKEGDLVFIRPQDIHCYDFYKSEDFSLINYGFSKEAMQSILNFLNIGKKATRILRSPMPPCVNLGADTEAVTANLLSIYNMEQCTDTKKTYAHAIAYFALLVCDYFIEFGFDEQTTPAWFRKTLCEMKKIENFRVGLPKMMELANCSVQHLCREMKKHENRTPTEFINIQRLNYSLYLLTQTDSEIITISEECGFNNLSHFYHLFKKRYGVTPLQFRNSGNNIQSNTLIE